MFVESWEAQNNQWLSLATFDPSLKTCLPHSRHWLRWKLVATSTKWIRLLSETPHFQLRLCCTRWAVKTTSISVILFIVHTAADLHRSHLQEPRSCQESRQCIMTVKWRFPSFLGISDGIAIRAPITHCFGFRLRCFIYTDVSYKTTHADHFLKQTKFELINAISPIF